MTGMRGWASTTKSSNLEKARLFVKLHAPFLAKTLYSLIPTPMPGLIEKAGGPLAVSKQLVMYFEPEWVEQEEVEIIATGLGHECFHVLLNHVDRGMSYPDPKQANLAGDLFINGMMLTAKRMLKDISTKQTALTNVPLWKMPEWAATPTRYGFPAGLTLDEYYQLLEKQKQKKKKEEEDRNGPSFMNGCCGGVGGNPLSGNLEEELDVKKGRADPEIRLIAKATAQDMKSYLNGPGIGSMAGNWEELIEISDKKFDVPWRRKLPAAIRSAVGQARSGSSDYSMRRPSKRSYLRGIMLPSLISYDPEIWFIEDSSGSMGGEQLADAHRLIADVLSQTGIKQAWWTEADVEHKRPPLRINVRDLQHMQVRGRGGTDFRPAIEFVLTRKPKPKIIFYITDGAGPAPQFQPVGVHFIWVIVPSPYKMRPAWWGHLIITEGKEEDLHPPMEWWGKEK